MSKQTKEEAIVSAHAEAIADLQKDVSEMRKTVKKFKETGVSTAGINTEPDEDMPAQTPFDLNGKQATFKFKTFFDGQTVIFEHLLSDTQRVQYATLYPGLISITP